MSSNSESDWRRTGDGGGLTGVAVGFGFGFGLMKVVRVCCSVDGDVAVGEYLGAN